MKGIIIDDEKGARDVIKNLVRKYSEKIDIVAEADGVNTGFEAIIKHNPDFIFLDIQLRNGTGFDLLERIDNLDFEIVFITAYDDYAIQAFKFSAFNYLLKPIDVTEFCKVISKLEQYFQKLKGTQEGHLKILVENYEEKRQVNKLVIKNIDGFEVLDINVIVRLEADRNYTHFFTLEGRKLTASKNIGEYEELLSKYGFFRIHQSSLVNLRHVVGYLRAEDGSVEMVNGDVLKISRLKKQGFLQNFT